MSQIGPTLKYKEIKCFPDPHDSFNIKISNGVVNIGIHSPNGISDISEILQKVKQFSESE